MVKKLSGSVMHVFKAQGHGETIVRDFERNRGKSENTTVIGRDVPRTALADFKGTFQNFYDEVHTSAVYEQHYLQGNLDGGNALDIYDIYKGMKNLALIEELDSLPPSPEKDKKDEEAKEFFETWTINRSSLRLAYRDDMGKLCSIGLVFNREEPNNWALQIVRNTTAPLSDRVATLFAQGELISSEQATEIEARNLPQEIQDALGSQSINALLSGLFNEKGDIVQQKVEELSERILPNQNIDNRDVKKTQLLELIKLANELLPDNQDLQEYFNGINQSSSADIDFYKDGNFEEALHALFVRIVSQIEQLENHKEPEIAFVKAKLTYFAIQLELKALSLNEESGSILRETYLEQAQKLRQLGNNPSNLEEYKDLLFSHFNTKVEIIAAKRLKVQEFIKNTRQRYDNEDFLSVKDFLSDLNEEIDSYTDEDLDTALKLCAINIEEYAETRAAHLSEKVRDFATKLEEKAASLLDTNEEVSQGISAKAKSLTELSESQRKKYTNFDFDQLLQETMVEIDQTQFKKNFLEQLNSLADTLPGNAPSFLQQSMKNKIEALKKIQPKEIVRLYKDKDLKDSVAVIINNLFKDEQVKQQKDLQKNLEKNLNDAKPTAPQNEGFLRRNRAPLILGALGILAFVSLVLTLTGVLAPLGIALGTAAAVTAGLVGAIVTAGVSVTASALVVVNEVQFANAKNDYQEKLQSHQEKQARFKEDCAEPVEQFKASFSEAQATFMTEYFEAENDRFLNPDDLLVEQPEHLVELEENADKLLDKASSLLSVAETEVELGLKTPVKAPVTMIPSFGKPAKTDELSHKKPSDEVPPESFFVK